MLSIVDLFKSDTRDDIITFFLDLAEEIELPVTSWRPGDPTRSILYLAAQKLSDLGAIIEALIRGGFLETATGAYLTLLAKFVYNVERDPARAAVGKVTLTNTSGTPYPLAANELVVAHGTSNKTYRNTSAVTVPGTGSITIDIFAEELGSASNASPGAISVVVSSLLGVTVANALPVLGRDEESDPALRQRCLDKLGALSPNGPAAAYEYLAKSTSVLVNRVRVIEDSDTGDVVVVVASPDGAVAGPDVATINTAIQESVVPLCITATTQSATGTSVPVAADVWVYTSANLSDVEIQAAVAAQLTSYFPLIPIGGDRIVPGTGKVYVDKLRGQIETALPAIFHAAVTSPGVDVALGDYAVATLPAPTITVHQVPPP